MRGAGTDVFVAGPYGSGDAGTRGIDDAAGYRALPANYDGGIWTNRIDLIGPLARAPRMTRARLNASRAASAARFQRPR